MKNPVTLTSVTLTSLIPIVPNPIVPLISKKNNPPVWQVEILLPNHPPENPSFHSNLYVHPQTKSLVLYQSSHKKNSSYQLSRQIFWLYTVALDMLKSRKTQFYNS